MNFLLVALLALISVILADDNFSYDSSNKELCPPPSEKDIFLAKYNVTTGGPYTYSQSKHHFYGTAFGWNHLK